MNTKNIYILWNIHETPGPKKKMIQDILLSILKKKLLLLNCTIYIYTYMHIWLLENEEEEEKKKKKPIIDKTFLKNS